MSQLKILIVEDDISFSVELELLVQDIGYEVLDIAEDGIRAKQLILEHHPDLILMDIGLKGAPSGLEVAEQIQHLNIPVLFLTSFDQQDLYKRAKKINTLGYLIKPIQAFSLRSAIELAIRTVQAENIQAETDNAFSTNTAMYFKKKGVYHKVFLKDILYFQSDDNYLIIYATKDRFMTKSKISDMEKLVPKQLFLKIHRSYLVNITKITKMDFPSNNIFIKSKALPITRSGKAALKKRLKNLN